MSRKIQHLIALAGTASAAIALAVIPTAAQAAIPRATPATSVVSAACTGDAKIIYSVNIKNFSGTVVGNVQLKYSPSCRVAWARVVSYLTYGSYAQVANSAGVGVDCLGGEVAGTGCNTAMINDAGVTSNAYGQVVDAYGNTFDATTNSY